jgi:hypothetical protein
MWLSIACCRKRVFAFAGATGVTFAVAETFARRGAKASVLSPSP